MANRPSYDIAVLGAGPAGVAAAVAGAAAGAKVLLVEAGDKLGGTVTAGLHRCLCGLYAEQPEHPWDTLNAGVQRDVVKMLAEADPEHVHVKQLGKTWTLEFSTSAWESVLARVCESPTLEVRLRTRLVGAELNGPRITTVQLQGEGPEHIKANVFVDGTGEGVLIRLAGADMAVSPEENASPWLAGYAVRLAGLTGDLEMLRVRIPHAFAQAVAAGSLPPEARFTMFHPGPLPGQGVCKLAISPTPEYVVGNVAVNERDSVSPWLEPYVRDVMACLVRDLPECAHARVVECSPRILARQGRRLQGRYVVTREDVLAGQGRNSPPPPGGSPGVQAWWPTEVWDTADGPTYAYPPIGSPYAVPDEALQSKRFDNLLAAGACVSATRTATASLRAGGICLATGDAAGRLAATM